MSQKQGSQNPTTQKTLAVETKSEAKLPQFADANALDGFVPISSGITSTTLGSNPGQPFTLPGMQTSTAVISGSITQHAMPVPPAEEARIWASFYPDAPKRMFDLAERQQTLMETRLNASIEAGKDTRRKNQTYRIFGLIAGLFVAAGFLTAGTIMYLHGNGSISGTVGSVAVDIFGVGAGMVSTFVFGRPLLDNNASKAPSGVPVPAPTQERKQNPPGKPKNNRGKKR